MLPVYLYSSHDVQTTDKRIGAPYTEKGITRFESRLSPGMVTKKAKEPRKSTEALEPQDKGSYCTKGNMKA